HEHKDHVAGMDDVRAFNFQLKKHIDVYASERVQHALKREYAYIFAEKKYPGIPQINLHEITDQPFAIEGVTFTPIQVWHHRLPVLGFRVGDFTYITDANRIDEAERAKIRGSKVVVLNALRQEPHLSHFNLEQAVEVMEDLQPEQGYFIHISHLMGKHRHAERGLPDFVRIAYDGLTVSL
ncbi:MAG: MBL fold metallo-hydrolase, partial [Bacteroidota bacterium]